VYEELGKTKGGYDYARTNHPNRKALERTVAKLEGGHAAYVFTSGMAGVDAVVAKGIVDEKNIGIAGHSWGGYQIAYMVTQTTRFKAVEAGAPVADMVSAYDGIRWGAGIPRQFQYEKTQSRIGKTLYDDPFKFVENSPVFHATGGRQRMPAVMP